MSVWEDKLVDGQVSPKKLGVNVRNESGGSLTAGTLVYVSSWSEAQKRLLVAKADADATGKAVYILKDTLANNTNGRAYNAARITGLNTNGATVGDPVYLSATAGGWTLTAPSTGFNQVVGRVAVVSATVGEIEFDLFSNVSGGPSGLSQTITSATPSSERLFYAKIAIDSATNTFAVGGGTGFLAGIRGEVLGTAGDTLTGAFIYGVDGRIVLPITFGNDCKVTGTLGKADLSSATINAGGQASGVWADLVGNPTIANDNPGQVYPLRVTNSMSVNAGALAFFYGNADYFAVADNDGHTATWLSTGAATPSGTMKKLKVQIGGTDLYILAAAVWS